MGNVQRVAPIFPVHDLAAALAHYERLGFTVHVYSGGYTALRQLADVARAGLARPHGMGPKA